MPSANAAEAALAGDIAVYGAKHLLDVAAHLSGERLLTSQAPTMPEPDDGQIPDLHDVRGQHHAKRALEIAAAGGHSLLFIGPPGAGKTMLASRLPGLLPRLTDQQAIETAAIQSLHKRFHPKHWRRRPFRAPHHTASAVALVGGGSYPRPGEISLAHHGVLFLDELPEFNRHVLEVLREPLESGSITISRAAHQAEFPARFQLVAAMNPCPCGYLGDSAGRCHCTPEKVRLYRARCRHRCSTALTCTWTCRRYRAINCWNKRRRPAKHPRLCVHAWRRRAKNRSGAAAPPTANSNRAKWMSFVR